MTRRPYRDPSIDDLPQDLQSSRLAALARHAERIQNEVRDRKISLGSLAPSVAPSSMTLRGRRGARRPVVCLTRHDTTTSGHPIYRSESDAAASVKRPHNNIIRAIENDWLCGGHRWQYLDAIEGEIVLNKNGFGSIKVGMANDALD